MPNAEQYTARKGDFPELSMRRVGSPEQGENIVHASPLALVFSLDTYGNVHHTFYSIPPQLESSQRCRRDDARSALAPYNIPNLEYLGEQDPFGKYLSQTVTIFYSINVEENKEFWVRSAKSLQTINRMLETAQRSENVDFRVMSGLFMLKMRLEIGRQLPLRPDRVLDRRSHGEAALNNEWIAVEDGRIVNQNEKYQNSGDEALSVVVMNQEQRIAYNKNIIDHVYGTDVDAVIMAKKLKREWEYSPLPTDVDGANEPYFAFLYEQKTAQDGQGFNFSGGGVRMGQTARDAAIKELHEEFWCEPSEDANKDAKVSQLMAGHAYPNRMDTKTTLFLIDGIKVLDTKGILEALASRDEIFRTKTVALSFTQVLTMIHTGEITDCRVIAAFGLLSRHPKYMALYERAMNNLPGFHARKGIVSIAYRN